MDISIHNVSDVSIESRGDGASGTRWIDLKIKWRGYGRNHGEQTITLFLREDAGHIAEQLAAALPQMEEA